MEKLVGASGVMERLREDILDLGQADGHVLIEGETGTGKSLVAHALHAVSARAKRKFIIFPCAGEEETHHRHQATKNTLRGLRTRSEAVAAKIRGGSKG